MTQEEIEIANRDYWFKVVDMLQQNWALLDSTKVGMRCIVFFISDRSGVFDQMEFDDTAEAERQLRVNGFVRFVENEEAGSFSAPPPAPFHRSSHPSGPIYSSGCIYRSSRTVKTVHAAQCDEKKALSLGLYSKCSPWSVLRGFFSVILLSIQYGEHCAPTGRGWHLPG